MQGCSFGYFVGGWGKPPVDERGRPLYGDVFGLDGSEGARKGVREEEEVDQTFWGELESEEEEEESSEVSEISDHVTSKHRSCDQHTGGGGRGEVSKT